MPLGHAVSYMESCVISFFILLIVQYHGYCTHCYCFNATWKFCVFSLFTERSDHSIICIVLAYYAMGKKSGFYVVTLPLQGNGETPSVVSLLSNISLFNCFKPALSCKSQISVRESIKHMPPQLYAKRYKPVLGLWSREEFV